MAPTIKRFRPGDRTYVRAQRVWITLACRIERQLGILTYGDLAAAMDLDRRAGIGLHRELGIVGTYCIQNDLPAIGCIVVSQETGTPGPGVISRPGRTWHDDQQDALRVKWFDYRVPTSGTFRQVWEEMQEAA
ncbi:MAG TPA: hypothetical protein VMT08_11675 [Bradyrhizobium sp.]|nr:hypothetical protein [Bradyrhizobium sp.]